jgi:PIN domain nuclease of toxin-antitoxin system
VILLDTHTLIWLMADDPRLGLRARNQIDPAFADAQVSVSAISFWEMAMLAERKRIAIAPNDVAAFRNRVISLGFDETLIDGEIAIAAGMLPLLHGDPADRLIVATAVVRGMTLVTADAAILRWNRKLMRIDARR